jgi:hypothetical protein
MPKIFEARAWVCFEQRFQFHRKHGTDNVLVTLASTMLRSFPVKAVFFWNAWSTCILKVSDEFTVPLWRAHHREQHRAGKRIGGRETALTGWNPTQLAETDTRNRGTRVKQCGLIEPAGAERRDWVIWIKEVGHRKPRSSRKAFAHICQRDHKRHGLNR